MCSVIGGHIDYGFSCAFSPCGKLLATGNQDQTVQIFDLRFQKTPIDIFAMNLGAPRSLKFSQKGILSIAEDLDYVHLIDPKKSLYETIEFVGEISGTSFDANGDFFYIGCSTQDFYKCIFEFKCD